MDRRLKLLIALPCACLVGITVTYFSLSSSDSAPSVIIQDDATDTYREPVALFPMSEHWKYGYIDSAGKVVISPQFEGADDFSEGLAAVKVGNAIGYIKC